MPSKIYMADKLQHSDFALFDINSELPKGDMTNPRGGVRHVILEKGGY